MDHRISPPLQSPLLSVEILVNLTSVSVAIAAPKCVLTRFPRLVQALSCTSYARRTHRRDDHIDFFAAFNSKLVAAGFTSLLSLPIFIFSSQDNTSHIEEPLSQLYDWENAAQTLDHLFKQRRAHSSPLRRWSRYGAARTAMAMTRARMEQNPLLIARHDSQKKPTNERVYCTLRRTLRTVVMAISTPTTQLYVEHIP